MASGRWVRHAGFGAAFLFVLCLASSSSNQRGNIRDVSMLSHRSLAGCMLYDGIDEGYRVPKVVGRVDDAGVIFDGIDGGNRVPKVVGKVDDAGVIFDGIDGGWRVPKAVGKVDDAGVIFDGIDGGWHVPKAVGRGTSNCSKKQAGAAGFLLILEE